MIQKLKSLGTKLLIIPVLSLAIGGIVATSASAAECSLDETNPLAAGQNCSRNESQPENLAGEDSVFKTITNVLLFLIGAISVIMIIYGGILYTTSGGDSSRVQSAKNTILYAVVGLVVAILGFAVTNFVIGAFAGN